MEVGITNCLIFSTMSGKVVYSDSTSLRTHTLIRLMERLMKTTCANIFEVFSYISIL